MARIVLTNVLVQVGGVDLSDHVASVSLATTYDVLETTAFAGGNVPAAAKTRIAGLADNSITLEFHQDFASGDVEQTIYPLLGTVAEVRVKPNTTGAVTPDNPEYIAQALISEWTPLNGAVGELATASVTWSISGPITKSIV
jgi:hypothetical protein